MGKFYISEAQAAETLSKCTGQNITINDMLEYAYLGIVPAYMKFSPKDKKLYPGRAFHLVHSSVASEIASGNLTTFEGCEEDFWRVLPFPLPRNGVVNTTVGLAYRVYVARSDAHLDEVSDQHYVRVYAPQEVRQAAKNVRRYLSEQGFQPVVHGCGETWEIDRDHDHDLLTASIVSPFTQASDSLSLQKRKRRTGDDSLSGEDMPCMRVVIAAMLDLIQDLSAKVGRKYTQAEIRDELARRFPGRKGLSKKSIDDSFRIANKAMEERTKEAQHKALELGPLVRTVTK